MTVQAGRSRDEYIHFLESSIRETADDAVRAVLETATVDARNYDRSLSPLATLARVVEACNAIESGEAAVLAREIGQFEDRLRPTRTPINSRTIEAYVDLRRARDERARRASEWTGPRSETLRRQGNLKRYVEARRDAANSKRPVKVGSRIRRMEELTAKLPTPEDRQDLRFELENGYTAQRKLQLLERAIEANFPEVRLQDILGGRAGKTQQTSRAMPAKISDEHRAALAHLRQKLTDNDRLRHFGLSTDGRRVRTLHTGAHFIEKSEYEALFAFLDEVLT